MARIVLAPVELDTGDVTYRVPTGWTIATLLPLLNTSAAPGLQNWAPDRWQRHRLADTASLPSPMLVTSFGHGKHSCPAQPFSLAAMSTAMTRLMDTYDMTPGWTTTRGRYPPRSAASRDPPIPVRSSISDVASRRRRQPGRGTHLATRSGFPSESGKM